MLYFQQQTTRNETMLNSIKKLKPFFIEDSRIPILLSYISPINIWAISLGIFVWCRGTINQQTKTHETIHFHQQLELLFLFQWILYGIFYLRALYLYRDTKMAYRENPFEREAYFNDSSVNYLANRKFYSWINYL